MGLLSLDIYIFISKSHQVKQVCKFVIFFGKNLKILSSYYVQTSTSHPHQYKHLILLIDPNQINIILQIQHLLFFPWHSILIRKSCNPSSLSGKDNFKSSHRLILSLSLWQKMFSKSYASSLSRRWWFWKIGSLEMWSAGLSSKCSCYPRFLVVYTRSPCGPGRFILMGNALVGLSNSFPNPRSPPWLSSRFWTSWNTGEGG